MRLGYDDVSAIRLTAEGAAEVCQLGDFAQIIKEIGLDVSVVNLSPEGFALSIGTRLLTPPPPEWPDREGEWEWKNTPYLVKQVSVDPAEFDCRLLRDVNADWVAVRVYLPRGYWTFVRPLSAFVELATIERQSE